MYIVAHPSPQIYWHIKMKSQRNDSESGPPTGSSDFQPNTGLNDTQMRLHTENREHTLKTRRTPTHSDFDWDSVFRFRTVGFQQDSVNYPSYNNITPLLTAFFGLYRAAFNHFWPANRLAMKWCFINNRFWPGIQDYVQASMISCTFCSRESFKSSWKMEKLSERVAQTVHWFRIYPRSG